MRAINPSTNPNSVYSHLIMQQYILSLPTEKNSSLSIISSVIKGVLIYIWVPPHTLDVTMACSHISEQFHSEIGDLSNDLAFSAE
jgi:hypothetical protein